MRGLQSISAARAVWDEAVRQAQVRRVRVTAGLVCRVHKHFATSAGARPVHLLSESLEWYTPLWLVEKVKQAFQGGEVDLDACSDAVAQQTVQAGAYFTEAQNGLDQVWHGRTFVNPPFGRVGWQSQQGLFLAKACSEQQAGHTTEVLLLLKAAVGYAWFQQALQLPHAFLTKKLAFCCQDVLKPGIVAEAKSNPHGSVVVYLGQHIKHFCNVFADVASVPGLSSWSATGMAS